MNTPAAELKAKILELAKQYQQLVHPELAIGSRAFKPGETKIPYAGRVFDHREVVNLVDSSLDFWLTAGPYAERFERRMQAFFSAKEFLAVNSGSSANLVMVSALCCPSLAEFLRPEDPRPLEPGDEVITPAVTFPTTLAPLVQNRLVPVFVDCRVGTYNIDPALIEGAIGERTRALFVPHTVGNPCDMAAIMELAQRHHLWVLEDGCDALGATFDGRRVGTFGAMSSLSFYPAHHMTMGEGGGVVINNSRLRRTARSVRDWGRDCWCDSGKSNTCGKRFEWECGELPYGYDHKYIYTNLGYNLKVTDLQAAIGLAQADKIEPFIAVRRHNFQRLQQGLADLEASGRVVLPRIDPRANPSPFCFPITVGEGTDRGQLIRWLEDSLIETRLVFAGNILRQPGFMKIARRVHGTLSESDRVMRDTFFIGVYPGLTNPMIDFVIERIQAFFRKPITPGE